MFMLVGMKIAQASAGSNGTIETETRLKIHPFGLYFRILMREDFLFELNLSFLLYANG